MGFILEMEVGKSKVPYIIKVELPFHSVRMIIFSSYRVDPLLYYGSISLEIYPFMDCGYSGTDIPVVAEHGEQVGSMCNVHVLRVPY